MLKLNEGQRYVTDPVDVVRTAYLVQEADVGVSSGGFQGAQTYTFQADDVGRLVEVVRNMSPGFMSWNFGSIFADLRKQYPETKPYRVEG